MTQWKYHMWATESVVPRCSLNYSMVNLSETGVAWISLKNKEICVSDNLLEAERIHEVWIYLKSYEFACMISLTFGWVWVCRQLTARFIIGFARVQEWSIPLRISSPRHIRWLFAIRGGMSTVGWGSSWNICGNVVVTSSHEVNDFVCLTLVGPFASCGRFSPADVIISKGGHRKDDTIILVDFQME